MIDIIHNMNSNAVSFTITGKKTSNEVTVSLATTSIDNDFKFVAIDMDAGRLRTLRDDIDRWLEDYERQA